ncbi:hypothetical protein PR048_014396 [Dryococelus australis]|uniref:RNA-directed DNA polymerase n=1 Tax=Dryococelus australis TaxID=614101 RepID=A0ABQ9HE22_9NEOP|nr:hypothetical protein PR048_014396 [Dryococelus australis]
MRVIEASMEQHRNERAGETGYPRENPPTNGIVWHDSHMQKSGVTRPGVEPISLWWEANRLTAQPPRRRTLQEQDCNCLENPPVGNAMAVDHTDSTNPTILWVDGWQNHIYTTDASGCTCSVLINATVNLHEVVMDGSLTVQVHTKTATAQLTLLVAEGNGLSLLGCCWLKPSGITVEGIYSLQQGKSTELVNQYPWVFANAELGQYEGPLSRTVAFALADRVREEIDRLVERGVYEPVTHSQWTTPIVPVHKADGSVRLCGNYKVTVNTVCNKNIYPLPIINEVFSNLAGGIVFTKLDLEEAYLQVAVDEVTSEILTVNTTKGLFRVKRLPFGISNAPAVFQRLMVTLLAGIPGVVVLLDDILITGVNEDKHWRRVHQVLGGIDDAVLRLKRDKCVFAATVVKFLRYQVDSLGIHLTAERANAIHEAPAPNNKKELYYWIMGKNGNGLEVHGVAFQAAKELLQSDTVLTNYDSSTPIVLTCDASVWRPIALGSCTLRKQERNYFQIDKEALAIMFGVTKFRQYLTAWPFIVITGRSQTASTSMAGTEIGHADALNRLPVQGPKIEVLMLEAFPDSPIEAEQLASLTEEDLVLSGVKYHIFAAWPQGNKPDSLRPYWNRRDQLSLYKGCLLWGNHVVVPTAVYMWWPGMDQDIEGMVSHCHTCQQQRANPATMQDLRWGPEVKPWSQLHIDFFGPFQGKTSLIVVDSYSKWVVKLLSSVFSVAVIQELREIFSCHGIPERVFSDNGTAFVSLDMKSFARKNGINLVQAMPSHPSSNGQAERMVRPQDTEQRSLPVVMEPKRVQHFQRGDMVLFQNYSGGAKWLQGVITAARGQFIYGVGDASGRSYKRHLDQPVEQQQQQSRRTDSPASSIAPAGDQLRAEPQDHQGDQQLPTTTGSYPVSSSPEASPFKGFEHQTRGRRQVVTIGLITNTLRQRMNGHRADTKQAVAGVNVNLREKQVAAHAASHNQKMKHHHYAITVREHLIKSFCDRWVGQGSAHLPAPLAWPPRSPDLSSCDNALWGLPPTSLTTDRQLVYWSNSSEGRIYSVVKSGAGAHGKAENLVAGVRRLDVGRVRQITAMGTHLQPYPVPDCLWPQQTPVQAQLENHTAHSITLRLPPPDRDEECGEVSMATTEYIVYYGLVSKDEPWDCRTSLEECSKLWESHLTLVVPWIWHRWGALPARHFQRWSQGGVATAFGAQLIHSRGHIVAAQMLCSGANGLRQERCSTSHLSGLKPFSSYVFLVALKNYYSDLQGIPPVTGPEVILQTDVGGMDASPQSSCIAFITSLTGTCAFCEKANKLKKSLEAWLEKAFVCTKLREGAALEEDPTGSRTPIRSHQVGPGFTIIYLLRCFASPRPVLPLPPAPPRPKLAIPRPPAHSSNVRKLQFHQVQSVQSTFAPAWIITRPSIKPSPPKAIHTVAHRPAKTGPTTTIQLPVNTLSTKSGQYSLVRITHPAMPTSFAMSSSRTCHAHHQTTEQDFHTTLGTRHSDPLNHLAPGMHQVVCASLTAPSEPREVSAVILSPNTVEVQWLPPQELNDRAVWYQVHWRCQDVVEGVRQKGEQVAKGPPDNGHHAARLHQMLPGQTYVIWVRANSQNSKEFTDSKEVPVVMFPEPNNITLVHATPYRLNISWLPTPNITTRWWGRAGMKEIHKISEISAMGLGCKKRIKFFDKGIIRSKFRYEIQCWEVGFGDWRTLPILPPALPDDRVVYHVGGLRPKTQYSFKLSISYVTSPEPYMWPSDTGFIYETLVSEPCGQEANLDVAENFKCWQRSYLMFKPDGYLDLMMYWWVSSHCQSSALLFEGGKAINNLFCNTNQSSNGEMLHVLPL